MKVATWNVNGLRARQGQFLEWLAAERPDVVCLQEIKCAAAQLPMDLCDLEHYWTGWHGERGYSGVGLLISKALAPGRPAYGHPPFDFEQRVITTTVATPHGPLTAASIYVPNGGKDFEAKMRFLQALDDWAVDAAHEGRTLLLCGDLNVAREDRDIHPKERKINQIGARPEERALLARIISRNLVDVGRALDPENEDLFTWWAPWRNLRQRNIGWRIDYVLASTPLAATARTGVVQREVGTSDHGPVVVTFA